MGSGWTGEEGRRVREDLYFHRVLVESTCHSLQRLYTKEKGGNQLNSEYGCLAHEDEIPHAMHICSPTDERNVNCCQPLYMIDPI